MQSPFRHIHARPRLFSSLALGGLLFALLPADWRWATRALIAWDACVTFYLILTALMIARFDIKIIRARAAEQDEGSVVMLMLTIIAAMASLAAIVAELALSKNMQGAEQALHIGLAGITVLLSWLFTQTMFALHYAHQYYLDTDGAIGGLAFPGDAAPDYWDFVYFSYIIGVAAQTADIAITAPGLRRIATLHCVLAFFFNTTILALTVNIGAALF